MASIGGVRRWTSALAPAVAFAVLLLSWGRDLHVAAFVVTLAALVAAVLSAVYHAEVIAHRVGEPYGSLVLAVAVTVIEVGLIVTLMTTSRSDASSLARDTVFAAVMICLNGIMGISLFIASVRSHIAVFSAEGSGSALATVAALATLSLVLPAFTTTAPGPTFATNQLLFAGMFSLFLYGLFVFVQTVRHSADFADEEPARKDQPVASRSRAWQSLGLLLVALVGVVGLAKVDSPFVERGLDAVGLPYSFVGVVIAAVVLLPEGLAAVLAARRNEVQRSLNLALGSAMASIGLTIPAVALVSVWQDKTLLLGLSPVQIALLALTVTVGVLTVTPGRSTLMQGGVHLAILAAFVFLSISP